MAFAAGVSTVWCGDNGGLDNPGGLMSTPATSAVIRCRGAGNIPFGGFICSASHNPGGINDDFGIKYNGETGGPSPEKMTDLMVEWTAKITEYQICADLPDFDLTKNATYKVGDRTIEVFDAVEDHMELLKKCFSFDDIKKLIARDDFEITYDY